MNEAWREVFGGEFVKGNYRVNFRYRPNKKYEAGYFIDNKGHTSYQTLGQFVTADEAKEACEAHEMARNI